MELEITSSSWKRIFFFKYILFKSPILVLEIIIWELTSKKKHRLPNLKEFAHLIELLKN